MTFLHFVALTMSTIFWFVENFCCAPKPDFCPDRNPDPESSPIKTVYTKKFWSKNGL
jgi:hypothetical protein